jgi:hypothetical protein
MHRTGRDTTIVGIRRTSMDAICVLHQLPALAQQHGLALGTPGGSCRLGS